MSARPVLVVSTSDHHVGSTLGLCPDEGVRLDDEGTYLPSKAQKWLWANWCAFWADMGKLRQKLKADLYCVFNGDLFDGAHHGTTQVISNNPEPAAYLAGRVFGIPHGLKPTRLFIVRGTEAHVGPSGATEEAFARSIRAEQNPETKTWSWWHLQIEVHGRLLDWQHHGRMGQRPWTRQNVVSNLAAQIFYERARRGLRHPDLAFRSHFHQHQDTHDAHPVRVIQLPAWQLKTSYAHRVVADSLADIGGVAVVITPDGQYDVVNRLYLADLPPAWKAS